MIMWNGTRWDDGVHQELARLEMPKVYLQNGRPAALMLAALAENDKDPQAHSFDLVIPLTQEGIVEQQNE